MRITELQAENVKRLKAVDITPDKHLQIIGGRNAQGKSSVLDAVALALTGKDAKKLTPRPLRDGESKGKVSLNLGDYVVTRTFTANGGGTLTVTAGDTGAKFPSPQKVLDDLMGRLSFDPQEFIGLTAKEQAAALLDLVNLNIDLDATDKQIADLSQERLIKGRELKSKGDYEPWSETLPKEEQSATTILNMIQTVHDRNRQIEDSRTREHNYAQNIVNIAHQIQQLQERLADTQEQQRKAKAQADFLGEPKDTGELELQLASIEDTNANIRANNMAAQHNDALQAIERSYNNLTAQIEQLRASKDKALAEADFPIAGLGFDESGVTFNNVPFTQASSMEQLRVSMAIAMASNPKLRVIRIKDGSLLDDDALAYVAKVAQDNDYQVLMERVGDKDPGAIIIEDGQVKK